MHYRLRYLSLATATLLLAVTSPVLPVISHLQPLVAQGQWRQEQEPGSEKWFLEAYQLWLKGEYPAALQKLQQDLVTFRKQGDRARVGAVLSSMGMVYRSMGQYSQALDYSKQALAILREVGKLPNSDRSISRTWEGRTLFSMGWIYISLGKYPQALEYSQQALSILKEVGDSEALLRSADRLWEGRTLNSIGLVYWNLGQYPNALEFYQQSLAIVKDISNRTDEAIALNNIGNVYNYLGQYPKALEFYQQALAIQKDIGDKAEEGVTLNNIGNVYNYLGEYPKALEFYQQAVAIQKDIGNKAREGVTLNNIGLVYNHLGEYPKALEFYQQALAILREIGARDTEGTTLSNIGYLLDIQNQPELAVVFYKQSVNIRETIRKDLRVLPKEQQESYTQTVAYTYRNLADILLKQDRVLEAQKVLDLLKLQELEDYLRNVRGNQQTQQSIEYLPNEQQLLTQYNAKLSQVVQLGKELTALQKIPQASRTPAQEKQRQEIEAAQQQSTREYLEFIRSPQVVAIVGQLNRTTDRTNVDLKSLPALQDNLKKLDQDAVLLYPLILDDRLELVLATPYAPPIRRTVPVKREELNRAIAQFRSALTNPSSNVREPAQKLYDWLIKPLEPALKAANTKTIIYAPDGQLRYIPLAALYDGKEWLVQKYRVNNITALSLTNLDKKPQSPKILAGAFSQGSYQVRVSEQTYAFGGLRGAGKEVENLVTVIPGTTKLVNQEFSKVEIEKRMSDYSIIHLATHAAFLPGKPEDSFILFGNVSYW